MHIANKFIIQELPVFSKPTYPLNREIIRKSQVIFDTVNYSSFITNKTEIITFL